MVAASEKMTKSRKRSTAAYNMFVASTIINLSKCGHTGKSSFQAFLPPTRAYRKTEQQGRWLCYVYTVVIGKRPTLNGAYTRRRLIFQQRVHSQGDYSSRSVSTVYSSFLYCYRSWTRLKQWCFLWGLRGAVAKSFKYIMSQYHQHTSVAIRGRNSSPCPHPQAIRPCIIVCCKNLTCGSTLWDLTYGELHTVGLEWGASVSFRIFAAIGSFLSNCRLNQSFEGSNENE